MLGQTAGRHAHCRMHVSRPQVGRTNFLFSNFLDDIFGMMFAKPAATWCIPQPHTPCSIHSKMGHTTRAEMKFFQSFFWGGIQFFGKISKCIDSAAAVDSYAARLPASRSYTRYDRPYVEGVGANNFLVRSKASAPKMPIFVQ